MGSTRSTAFLDTDDRINERDVGRRRDVRVSDDPNAKLQTEKQVTGSTQGAIWMVTLG